MAFLSPGVYITERDESTIVPTVSNNVAFFAGDFDKGPVDQPYVVTTRKELIDRFGLPTNDNFNEWYQASKYLDYANQLIVTRGFEDEVEIDISSGAQRSDYKYTKVGTYTRLSHPTPATGDPVDKKTAIMELSMGEGFELPKYEIGDVLIVCDKNAAPSTGSVLCKVSTIESQTGGVVSVTTVTLTAESEIVIGNNASLAGDIYSLSASHKNGKTYALNRGDSTKKDYLDPVSGDIVYSSNVFEAQAISDVNMDYVSPTALSGTIGTNRLSASYPLIKNNEEWDYLNTRVYGQNDVNPLRVWTSAAAEAGNGAPDMASLGKLLFFTRTPTSDSVEVAIANKEDFETLYDQNTSKPYNLAIAFMETHGKLEQGMYLTDLFQYYPAEDEIGLVFKQGDNVETFVVSFNPRGVDGNGKSNYIETVINENSKLLYVLNNAAVSDMPATYLSQDKYGMMKEELTEKIVPAYKPSEDKWGVATETITVQGGKAPKISTGSLHNAYFTVEDKEKYEIDVVIGNERNPSAAQDLAEKRKDCIAFIGARYEDTVGKKAIDATNDIIRYLTEEDPTKRAKSSLGSKLQRTMFSAFFGNYFKIYDTYNKTHRWINVAGDMAGVRCSVTTENASWWVSAGMRRGIINNIERMAFTPSEPMRDQLYKNSINPLVTFPGTGNLVWGNKTMQAYASAFDRINVRNMFSTIERAMAKAAKSQLFEFNDPYTRNAILSMFNPYLATVKAGRGLTDFLVICDETNNTPDVISRNELRVDIYVKPNYAAEFINLNFINVGTRSFSEVIGA